MTTTGVGADSYLIAQSRIRTAAPIKAPRVAVRAQDISILQAMSLRDLFSATKPAEQPLHHRVAITLRDVGAHPAPIWFQTLVRMRMFLQLVRLRADKAVPIQLNQNDLFESVDQHAKLLGITPVVLPNTQALKAYTSEAVQKVYAALKADLNSDEASAERGFQALTPEEQAPFYAALKEQGISELPLPVLESEQFVSTLASYLEGPLLERVQDTLTQTLDSVPEHSPAEQVLPEEETSDSSEQAHTPTELSYAAKAYFEGTAPGLLEDVSDHLNSSNAKSLHQLGTQGDRLLMSIFILNGDIKLPEGYFNRGLITGLRDFVTHVFPERRTWFHEPKYESLIAMLQKEGASEEAIEVALKHARETVKLALAEKAVMKPGTIGESQYSPMEVTFRLKTADPHLVKVVTHALAAGSLDGLDAVGTRLLLDSLIATEDLTLTHNEHDAVARSPERLSRVLEEKIPDTTTRGSSFMRAQAFLMAHNQEQDSLSSLAPVSQPLSQYSSAQLKQVTDTITNNELDLPSLQRTIKGPLFEALRQNGLTSLPTSILEEDAVGTNLAQYLKEQTMGFANWYWEQLSNTLEEELLARVDTATQRVKDSPQPVPLTTALRQQDYDCLKEVLEATGLVDPVTSEYFLEKRGDFPALSYQELLANLMGIAYQKKGTLKQNQALNSFIEALITARDLKIPTNRSDDFKEMVTAARRAYSFNVTEEQLRPLLEQMDALAVDIMNHNQSLQGEADQRLTEIRTIKDALSRRKSTSVAGTRSHPLSNAEQFQLRYDVLQCMQHWTQFMETVRQQKSGWKRRAQASSVQALTLSRVQRNLAHLFKSMGPEVALYTG